MPVSSATASTFLPYLSVIFTDFPEEQVMVSGPRCMIGTSSPAFMLSHSSSLPFLSWTNTQTLAWALTV